MQNHLNGGATVVNRGEAIRDLLASEGEATTERLATVAIHRGIYSETDADRALLSYAKQDIRRHLKRESGGGLPFAGPVVKREGVQLWKQRELWDNDEYIDGFRSGRVLISYGHGKLVVFLLACERSAGQVITTARQPTVNLRAYRSAGVSC
jgi:hypothetical protein